MFDKFKNMFALTLTDIAWNWFELIMDNTHNMYTLKENSLKASIHEESFLKTVYILVNTKFNHTKHDIEEFSYDLKDLGKMIVVSDKQVLDHFKEAFPINIEAQLPEIDDIDIEIGKARVLV